MPSSSTHTAASETHLHACYRIAHIRLRSLGASDYAAYITEAFAQVLDIDPEELRTGFWPPGPIGKKIEVAREELKVQQAIEKRGMGMSEGEKLGEVCDVVAEAGVVLEKRGRSEEGRSFGVMARELHEYLMKREEAREVEAEWMSGSEAGDDVEMEESEDEIVKRRRLR